MGNFLSGEQERLILVRNELSTAHLNNRDIWQRAPSIVPCIARRASAQGARPKAFGSYVMFSQGEALVPLT